MSTNLHVVLSLLCLCYGTKPEMFEVFEEAGTSGEADCAARVPWHVEPRTATQDVRKDSFRHRAKAELITVVARDIGVAVRTAHAPHVTEPGATAPHTYGTHRFAFATGRNPKLMSQ